MKPNPTIRFLEFNWQPANWLVSGLASVGFVQALSEIRWV